MDTSTGLIAVILDTGTASLAALGATVDYARSANEIVRAVVVTPRPDAIQDAVSPARALEATTEELSQRPSFALLSRVAAWSQKQDGELVRLVVTLDPHRPLHDPWVVYECLQRLITNAYADGVVGVKKSGDGPRWRPDEEWVRPEGAGVGLVEDPSLYIFRREFLADAQPSSWRGAGHFLPYEILSNRH